MPRYFKQFVSVGAALRFVFAVLLVVTLVAPPVAAQEDELTEIELRRSGIHYYDSDDGGLTCAAAGGTVNPQEDFSRTGFFDAYVDAAFAVGKAYSVPYEAVLAQAAIESGNGDSKLTREALNFFGIKAGDSWNGPIYTIETREELPDGSSKTVEADFRAYASAEAGFAGYGQFIHANDRYSRALEHPADPYQYIVEIKAAGYATDSQYVTTVHSVIEAVEEYVAENTDLPPSSEVVFDSTIPADTSGISNCAGAPGVGVSASGLHFPLLATKTVIDGGSDGDGGGVVWCKANCHGTAWGGAIEYYSYDIGAPEGTPVVAARSGIVTKAADSDSGERRVWIASDNDRYYYYAHMATTGAKPSVGQQIQAGQKIGEVGGVAISASSGASTDSHLHFSVSEKGQMSMSRGCSQTDCPGMDGLVDVLDDLLEGYNDLEP